MSKVPVLRSREFNIYYELVNGCIFVHCDVFRWSKSVREKLLIDIEILFELLNTPVYARHVVGDKKHEKFLKLVGFKPLRRGYDSDLKQIEIYIKE